jgi:hypothetical protein
LGYAAVGGGFRDGGPDDNFYRRKFSPATDRGDSWNTTPTDLEGFARVDDPGTVNSGRNDYFHAVLGSSLFAATGTAQPSWRSNSNSFSYTLPFAFNFYGTSYTTLYVSTEGFLQFGDNSSSGDSANAASKLLQFRRIAPMWDNVRTNNTGDDIFVDATVAGQVKFRWNATNEADNSDAQFAVVLFNDGRIRFDYGPGLTNLTPTVGIGAGDGRNSKLVPLYDGATTLTNSNSVEWSLLPGITDMGAYEFRGSSFDVTAPAIVGSFTTLDTDGNGAVDAMRVNFSEEMNPIDANAPANFELRLAGPNGLFGDADDTVFGLDPTYAYGGTHVDLDVIAGNLPDGFYRFTVYSNAGQSIHDLAGLRLDGDANGTEGGDFVRTFNLNATNNPAFAGTSGDDTYYLRLNAAGTHLELFLNATGTGTPSYTSVLSTLSTVSFDGMTGNDRLIVDLVNGLPIPSGGVSFAGGAHTAGDRLTVLGTAGHSAVYAPSGITNGSGTFTIAGRTVSTLGIEPIDVSGFASLSVVTPNANDVLSVTSAQAGQNTISGTSGGLAFSPLAFSSIATVIVAANANDAGGGNDSLTISSAGLIAAGINRLQYESGTGANSLTIEGGFARVDSTVAFGGTLTTTVQGGAQLTTQHFRQTGLALSGAGSRATVLASGTTAGTSALESLSLGLGTQLDITNNVLIVRAAAGTKDAVHADLQSKIISAQNGFDENFITRWDGPGITSSSARSTNLVSGFDLTALGVIRNSDLDVITGLPDSGYTSFGGQGVGPDDVLIKYTYTGDGNLDGAVTFDDYAAMDSAFFELIPIVGWAVGDVNFDNAITFDDYSVVDQAFFFQGPPLSPAPPRTPPTDGAPLASAKPRDVVLTRGGLLIEGPRHHVTDEALWSGSNELRVYSDVVLAEVDDGTEDNAILELAISASGVSNADTPAAGKVRRSSRDLWDLALLEIAEE